MTCVPPGPSTATAAVELSRILRRIADELGDLAALVTRIEDAVAADIARPPVHADGAAMAGTAPPRDRDGRGPGPTRSRGAVSDLQELDRLRQTLEDLARLTAGLSDLAPGLPVDPSGLASSLRLRGPAGRIFRGEDAGAAPGTAGTLTML